VDAARPRGQRWGTWGGTAIDLGSFSAMQKPPHANNICQKQDTVLDAVDSLEPLLMIVRVLPKLFGVFKHPP